MLICSTCGNPANVGITVSSLFGLENCQQSITLKTLQQALDQLKCDLADILPAQV